MVCVWGPWGSEGSDPFLRAWGTPCFRFSVASTIEDVESYRSVVACQTTASPSRRLGSGVHVMSVLVGLFVGACFQFLEALSRLKTIDCVHLDDMRAFVSRA